MSKENRERQSRKSALSAIGWDVAYGRKENFLAVLFCIHCFFVLEQIDKKRGVFEMKKSKFSTQQLVMGGLLLALAVIVSYQNIYLYPPHSGRITLQFIPIIYGGILLGPQVGLLIGALQDPLTYFLTPGSPGTYFPGFMLTSMLMGFFPGFIIKSIRDAKMWNITLVAFVSYIITMGLDSLWLSILMGKAYLYFLTTRAIPNLVQVAITVAVLMVLVKRVKIKDFRNE